MEFASDFDFVYDMRRKTEVREAADAYLEALVLFSRRGIGFDEGIRKRDAYVDALAEIMASKLRFKRRWVAVKGFSDLVLAGLTSPLHFAAGWLLSFGVDPLRNRLIERMLKARVRTALCDEGGRTASAGLTPDGKGTMPLARKLGLYLGPLSGEGVKRLVATIDPHPAVRSTLPARPSPD